MESSHGASKCNRKSALSVFFLVELVAFTFSLASLLSPSWQYVYLEKGRTEHHHGLWLDCKRDYSFDYGRTREYYETLWRRDLQGSPFQMFYLPPLECVYKFDYYIDPEDLYDHNHDENRLQDDAYQHLFLGHKIAALVACGVAVVMSAFALLLGICAYCHRTFIAAMTVLVTVSAILCTIGISVFFAWGNYQDNKVIKQQDEEEIYEQYLGWAFFFQVSGAVLHFIASVLGCLATSVAAVKRRAKLVRIDVVESGSQHPSSADLLSSHPHISSSEAPFKRSFSAIYRVDSSALQQWEKDYQKNTRRQAMSQEEAFKRTASMPMLTKKQRKSAARTARAAARSSMRASSSSNLFAVDETSTTGTTNTLESVSTHRKVPNIPTPEPPKQLKSALKTPQFSKRNMGQGGEETSGPDTTYEYLPCDEISLGVSSFLGGRTPSKSAVYDPVFEQSEPPNNYLEPDSRMALRNSSSTVTDEETAKQPKRVLLPCMAEPSGSVQSIPTGFSSSSKAAKATVINDVAFLAPQARSTTSLDVRPSLLQQRTTIREQKTIEELERLEITRRKIIEPAASRTAILPPMQPPKPQPPAKPSLTVRDFGIGINDQQRNGYMREVRENEAFDNDSESHAPSNGELCLNTFGSHDQRGSQRSLTSLPWRPGACAAVEAFERPDSSVDPLSNSSVNGVRKQATTNLRKQLLIGTLPDEVDRSVGSTTTLENDTINGSSSSPSSTIAREAEIRLNLFFNDNRSYTAPAPPPKPSSTISLSSLGASSSASYSVPQKKRVDSSQNSECSNETTV